MSDATLPAPSPAANAGTLSLLADVHRWIHDAQRGLLQVLENDEHMTPAERKRRIALSINALSLALQFQEGVRAALTPSDLQQRIAGTMAQIDTVLAKGG